MQNESLHRLPFQRLLIELTLTEADAGFLAYTAAVAKLCETSELHFVYPAKPPSSPPSAAPQELATIVRQKVERHFGSAVTQIKTHYHALQGKPAAIKDAIEANDIDVLLVGVHPQEPERQQAIRRLVRELPCALWVVPTDTPPVFSRLLAPIDFSASATAAFQVAVTLAYATDALLLALHVYFNKSVTTYDEYAEVLREEKRAAAFHFKRAFDLTGVSVRLLLEESAGVASTVARVAREEPVDLIVMGTRGRRALSRLLLKSLSEEVMEEIMGLATMPMLIVKTPGGRLGLRRAVFDKKFREKNDLRFG